MQVVDHNMQATEEWRAGVVTRMRVSAVTGAVALCIFEQWCAPGTGEPTHTHPVEEVLTILDGQAEIWLGDDQVLASVGQSVIVPAGIRHGFRNAAAATLHIQGTLASSTFEAFVDGQRRRRDGGWPNPVGGVSAKTRIEGLEGHPPSLGGSPPQC